MRKHLLLSAAVVAVDQVTKALIVRFVPEGTVALSLFGDFLRIVHVRNDAVAFSLGSSLSLTVKMALFVLLPLVLVAGISIVICSDKLSGDFTKGQRWCLAGIAGGGAGNLVDRLFRSLRVVDWISTNNYGWFGMERFPTYNLADAAVVVSVAMFIILALREQARSGSVKEN